MWDDYYQKGDKIFISIYKNNAFYLSLSGSVLFIFIPNSYLLSYRVRAIPREEWQEILEEFKSE